MLFHSRSCLCCHGRGLCLTWLAANPLRLGRKATLTPLLPHCTSYSPQQLQPHPLGPFTQRQITYRSVRRPMEAIRLTRHLLFPNLPSPPRVSSLFFINHSIQDRYQCSYIAPRPDAPRRLSMVPPSAQAAVCFPNSGSVTHSVDHFVLTFSSDATTAGAI